MANCPDQQDGMALVSRQKGLLVKKFLFQDTEALSGEQLFERAPIGLAVTDTTRIVRVNPAFCRFLGYSKQELLGKTIRDVTYPDDWEDTVRFIRKFRSSKTPTKPLEKRYRHKNGHTVWGEISLFVIRDGSHKTPLTMAQVVDITERKRAEDALLLANERFRVALAGSPTTVFSQDRELRYKWVYNEVIPFKDKDMLGKRDSDFLLPADAQRRMRIKREVMKTGVAWRGEIDASVNGKKVSHDLIVEPLRNENGRIIGIICAAIDITQRKLMEESLAKANEELEQKVKYRTAQLKKLTEELIRAEHHERRRIADILHDHLQQHLCGMKFRASELKEKSSDPSSVGLADRLVADLDQAIHVTRTLSADLYPSILNHLGVKAGIESLANDLMHNLGLSVKARFASRIKFASAEMEMFVFDAIRELLLNVVKHAKVKTAEVRVSPMPKELVRIQVKDAGVGFDAKRNDVGKNHFGLFRIQERTESFGGRLEVISQPNKGTCISIILPCRKKAKRAVTKI